MPSRTPRAYFLTWTCYGAWLHGDPRGSVAPGWNAPGTAYLAPNASRMRLEQRRLEGAPAELDPAARAVVAAALRDHATFRGWELVAVNVRSNHVHLVIRAADVSPERMMTEFKAWATRRLREQRLVTAEARVWTRHGSTRYLWRAEEIEAAAEYVLHGQDGPGRARKE